MQEGGILAGNVPDQSFGQVQNQGIIERDISSFVFTDLVQGGGLADLSGSCKQ